MYQEGLKNENNRKLIKSRMHELLSDPFYYGKMRWKNEIHNGQQKPLISKELFDTVQTKLTRKIASPQYKKHLPVFKAKIKCEECGGTITWEIQRGHWYGHCNHYKNCSQRAYVRQEKVEEQLFPYFDKVAPKNERILNWLGKALKESHAGEIEYYNTQRKELTAQFEKTQRRLEVIYEDKIDGKIPVDFYERKFKEYSEEKETILEKLNKFNQTNIQYYQAGYAIHELALKAKEIYQSKKATIEEKRLLLSYVFSNIRLNDAKIKPNYTLAFEFLADWMPKVNKNFEQAKNRLNKRKTDDLASVCPELLPLRDAFRTLDWKKIREEIEPFRIIMEQKLLTINA